MVKPVSLRFEDDGVRKARRPSVYVIRAAAACLHAFATKATPLNASKAMYGHDPATEMVLRASTSPAEIGTTGWATELAQHGVRDLIASVTSVSAAAALLNRAVKVDIGEYAQLRIPGRVLDVNSAGTWVAEGAPITVRQLVTTQGAVLQRLPVWCRQSAAALLDCRAAALPRLDTSHRYDIDRRVWAESLGNRALASARYSRLPRFDAL